jgi:ferredoxin
MIKIVHDRENCIGCGSCVAVCPRYWEMAEDGKSNLKGSKKRTDGKFELEVGEAECNDAAAQVCPVNVIKIE